MNERLAQPPLFIEALAFYAGNWKRQAVVYAVVFFIALAAAISLDLGTGARTENAVLAVTALTAVLLFLAPISYVIIRRRRRGVAVVRQDAVMIEPKLADEARPSSAPGSGTSERARRSGRR